MKTCDNCSIAWDERDYNTCPVCEKIEEIETLERKIQELE